MLLGTVLILLIFVPLRIFSSENLCRLIEFHVPKELVFFHANDIEETLFYKTDYTCQNKPVLRSIKYQYLYQFQSTNNRWWTLYDTRNSTYEVGVREWCDAWNMKPLLSMPLGAFQHPLGKIIKAQRWKQVILHEKNRSFTYKSMTNVYLKCYYPPSTFTCQTHQLTFLLDLTETTNTYEWNQMKLLTKTLVWLLINQTNLAISYYSDTLHVLHSFVEKTSTKSLEHLYDSIDALDRHNEDLKKTSVPWYEAIHRIATIIFKRRFLLPFEEVNITSPYQFLSNDSSEENTIYTEPYPLIDFDELAIRTILNITANSERKKRSLNVPYDKSKHVLVILTSRSKHLYDYQQRDKQLAEFIASVPLRIVVMDFNRLSDRGIAEYIHSAFIYKAKYALATHPVTYNYIHTYEELGDAIHSHQLFDHYRQLCNPPQESLFKNNFNTTIMETSNHVSVDCSLLTLFNNRNNVSLLADKFDYTFYKTTDQCFSTPVYRSLGDRNLYVQKNSNGRWLIIHVDPLLPSIASIQRKAAFTTTSTLAPEFFYATDYANGPIVDDINNETSVFDLPTSVPHCSDKPGIDILWESTDHHYSDDYSLRAPHQWKSATNKTGLISPVCNKYRISCQALKFDFLILIDSHQEYSPLIRTFLNVFLALIQPYYHRFSLIILSSSNMDTFQFHLPLTSIHNVNNQIIGNFLLYLDDRNQSIVDLSRHLEHASDYLLKNQDSSANVQSQKIVLTIPSRLNFNEIDIKQTIQRYSSIRYMVLDPYLRDDDHNNHHYQREKTLSSLTSSPSYENLFSSYAAYRDLTFHTVFRLLESLCGNIYIND